MQKNLYDLFYEGSEPSLNPAGLFDYSKGQWTAITATTKIVQWSNGELVTRTSVTGETRKLLLEVSGFTNSGAGKLIGPDGNEMDSEAFLSDLHIIARLQVSQLKLLVHLYQVLYHSELLLNNMVKVSYNTVQTKQLHSHLEMVVHIMTFVVHLVKST
jgi:hypothetical protein